LISESYAQGVRTIVSTSHRRKGMFEEPEEKIFENFSIVKEEAEKQFPDLQIHYGGELFYTSSLLKKIENHLVPNIAD
ncbi:CpsB/CapC family capsule biosynthesis tyrosine phosphatase, partial [Streptococcus pyogenes]